MKDTLGRPVLAFCLFFGLHVIPTFAQQATAGALPAKADYSQEPFVIEQMSSKVAFQDDGTSVRQQTTRIRVQNDTGVQQWGLIELPFESGTSTLDIDYVRVRKPDGTVVVTPPDNIQDLDAEITRNAPLYSDVRVKHIAVKGLTPGDVLEFQAHWTSTKPLAPGQFWFDYNFDKNGIVLDERLEVSVPSDRPVKVRGPQGTQMVAESAGRRVYTWTGSNLSSKPAKKSGRATLDASLGLNHPPDVEVSSFKSWDEVASWYWNLQKDRVEPSPAVRAKAAELIKGMTDDSAKLRAIYDFVSTHYRYIGIDFGIGRYQPHSADDVLSNNFGDCKDKQTLLASLLQAAGIQADPVLISTSSRFDPDIPSPQQFDHVIGYVPEGKTGFWLDTTPEITSFGYLLPVLRGKQALVIVPGGTAQIMTTPPDPPDPELHVFKVTGKLSVDGTLNAQIENTNRDDFEPVLREAFRQVSSAQWTDLAQRFSRGLNFAGTVSDVNVASPEASGVPFHFSYSYLRKDYPDWADRQITVPGLPYLLPALDDDADPSDPIFLGSPSTTESDARIELPSDYMPALPTNVDLVRDYAEYHASYSRDGNTLVVRRVLTIKLREVPTGENSDYKKFADDVHKDVDGYVQITSGNPGPLESVQDVGRYLASSLNALPDSTVSAANTFESNALKSARESGPGSAVSGLKQAVAADPKFTRAWIRLAELQAFMRNADDAADSFRKAIASDPKQPILYKVFALMMASLQREDDAIGAWQDLLKIAPDDADAPSNLGSLLVRNKRYAEAIPLLQSALKSYPKSANVNSNLAIAFLLSGKPDDGHAALQQALAFGKPGLIYNNVAWALAAANQDLPEALDYAQKAVQQAEDDSQSIDVEKITEQDLGSPSQLAAFWDTLGWVEFRLNHLDQAENLLSAAFALSQWGDEADHLGQVYEKEHKTQDAIRMYRFALNTTERRVQGVEEDTVSTRLQGLRDTKDPGLLVETHPDGKTTKIYHLGEEGPALSEMRTVKLSRIVPGSAEAEFFLLFSPGPKVEGVDFINGSDQLKSATKVLSAAPFQVPFPKDSSARILRRALLMCSEASGCSVTLYPIDSVHSVN
jgi:tetratricopeptide (TPR) repeat protein/transglutaminase-like putative cysteine protease